MVVRLGLGVVLALALFLFGRNLVNGFLLVIHWHLLVIYLLISELWVQSVSDIGFVSHGNPILLLVLLEGGEEVVEDVALVRGQHLHLLLLAHVVLVFGALLPTSLLGQSSAADAVRGLLLPRLGSEGRVGGGDGQFLGGKEA